MKNDGFALLRVLAGERVNPPPVWIMRQAGRYLPEYRELRKRANGFLDFCYSPALCVEAALQPLRRYPLDAAILFSDILTVPDALGRKVSFVEGEGPKLDPLIAEDGPWRFDDPQKAIQRLAPVYEAVERTRAAIPADVALIGFAGAPWTVATYMLQGEGGDKDRARRAAYARPHDVDRLIEALVEATAQHLAAQVAAGANSLQLFESWAEDLPEPMFARLVIAPTAKLTARLKALGVTAPLLGFPRGVGQHLERYANETGVAGLGLDFATPPQAARKRVPAGMALQGNLDPQLLVVGGEALDRGVEETLIAFGDGPHIFNLGHGITPEADPEHLARVIARVKRGV